MNYYVLVEGKGEKKIYPVWINSVNPELTQVYELTDILNNNFFIFGGNGYPYIKTHNIPAAIEDVNSYPNIDRLVIVIDSEEMSFQDKYNEINSYVQQFVCNKPIDIIVQYFCLECWGLGNRSIFRRHPQNQQLLRYQRHYNVIIQDPELLPDYPEDDLNRVAFAYKYLHKAINDRYSRTTYSKSRPDILANSGYFFQLRNRVNNTNHIHSFQRFIEVFTNNN